MSKYTYQISKRRAGHQYLELARVIVSSANKSSRATKCPSVVGPEAESIGRIDLVVIATYSTAAVEIYFGDDASEGKACRSQKDKDSWQVHSD